MIILFDADVHKRLHDIEANEGTPPEEFVREAVHAWSMADGTLRRSLSITIMREALASITRE